MSTDWGYACISHDPPLVSETWINHGRDALIEAIAKVRNGTWPRDEYPAPVIGTTGDRSESPIYWLDRHPACRVAVYNEYGETWFTDDGPWQITGMDDRRARRPVRDATGQATGEWVNGVYPPEGERACACATPVPLVTHPSLLWDWVRCATCTGTHLVKGTR